MSTEPDETARVRWVALDRGEPLAGSVTESVVIVTAGFELALQDSNLD
jgi:hypothetical protein